MKIEIEITPQVINDALWAACDTRFIDGPVPSMESVSECAFNAVASVTGLTVEELEQIHAEGS